MAKRFEVPATGLISGLPFRIDIYDPQYSSTDPVLEVQDERQYVLFDVGGDNFVGKKPIKTRQFRLSMVRNQNVEVLTDRAEDDVRFEAFRTDTSDLWMKGFLAPNQYTDTPLAPQPDVVEMVGSDGLGLLEGGSFGDLSFDEGDKTFAPGNPTPVMQGIRRILNTIFASSLDMNVGVEWWPETANLTSSDLPLQNAWFDLDNYRESRPDGSVWWNQLRVLKDLLSCHGCVLQQTRVGGSLVWHLRQRSAIGSAGSIDLWTVQPDGTTTYDGSTDISVDLDVEEENDKVHIDHARDFVRRRQKIEGVHDFVSPVNYIRNGGFEQWDGKWFITDGSNVVSDLIPHDAIADSPSGTPGNEVLGRMSYDSDSADGSIQFGFEQTAPSVLPGNTGALRISMNMQSDAKLPARIQLNIGGFYLDEFSTSPRGSVRDGDVELPVDQLQRDVPEGARLVLLKAGESRAFLDVSERAKSGSPASIRGRLSRPVDSSWILEYFGLSGTSGWSSLTAVDVTEWGPMSITIPAKTPAGDALPQGDMTLRLGIETIQKGVGVLFWVFDDIRVEPIKGGRSMNEKVSTASVGTFGKSEDPTRVRLGSGPSTNNAARLIGDVESYASTFLIVGISTADDWVQVDGDATTDLSVGDKFDIFGHPDVGTYEVDSISYDSGNDTTTIFTVTKALDSADLSGSVGTYPRTDYDAFFWGVGSNATTTFVIEELRARERLRYFRGQNQRYEAVVTMQDAAPIIHGHEHVTLDGTVHTVSSVRTRPSTGKVEVTLVQHNDYGTA